MSNWMKRIIMQYQINQCIKTISAWQLRIEQTRTNIREIENKINSNTDNSNDKLIDKLNSLYGYLNDCECAVIRAKNIKNGYIDELQQLVNESWGKHNND